MLSWEGEFQAQRAIAEAEVEALADTVQRRTGALNDQELRMNDDVLFMRAAEADVRRDLAAEAGHLTRRENEVGLREQQVEADLQGRLQDAEEALAAREAAAATTFGTAELQLEADRAAFGAAQRQLEAHHEQS